MRSISPPTGPIGQPAGLRPGIPPSSSPPSWLRPGGPRRFTVSGASIEIQGFSARNPSADATLGSNSHGHGPYTYWPDASGLARILGESIDWIGPEADPDFGGAAIDAQPFPFTAGQWRSVTAINRWLYATHYSSLGSIDGDLFYGYIGGGGRGG